MIVMMMAITPSLKASSLAFPTRLSSRATVQYRAVGSSQTALMTASDFNPAATTRPDPALLKYYIVQALMVLPAFPFVMLPLYFKYHTLEYKFDDEGISMSWGVLMRREIYLTYRRIQDIHVTRNLIHRWLGLAAVGVQTASGSTSAEMTIEGIRNPEALRDYLYQRMRGARDEAVGPHGEAPEDEALRLLVEIRDALRAGKPREERA
jgi:putative membrane protein